MRRARDLLARWVVAQEQHGSLGEGPLEGGIPQLLAGAPRAFAGGCFGTRDEPAIGHEVLHPREAVESRDLVPQDEGQDLPDARERAQAGAGLCIARLGRWDEIQRQLREQAVVVIDQPEVHRDAFLHGRLGKACGASSAVGLVGDVLAERGGVQSHMDEKRALLCHFLAALAYRSQKALREAPAAFGDFRIAPGVRTPAELVRHMTSVLGYARTFFIGGAHGHEPLPTLVDEVVRFHAMLEDLAGHLERGTPLQGTTPERLLQGPFADAMTHAGQLAMLRRLAGSPVPPENFIVAAIDPAKLSLDQPPPVSPDREWPEAPPGWQSPAHKPMERT